MHIKPLSGARLGLALAALIAVLLVFAGGLAVLNLDANPSHGNKMGLVVVEKTAPKSIRAVSVPRESAAQKTTQHNRSAVRQQIRRAAVVPVARLARQPAAVPSLSAPNQQPRNDEAQAVPASTRASVLRVEPLRTVHVVKLDPPQPLIAPPALPAVVEPPPAPVPVPVVAADPAPTEPAAPAAEPAAPPVPVVLAAPAAPAVVPVVPVDPVPAEPPPAPVPVPVVPAAPAVDLGGDEDAPLTPAEQAEEDRCEAVAAGIPDSVSDAKFDAIMARAGCE